MHNLFLGTAKRMMEKWRSAGLITNRHLTEMQQQAETMVLPSDFTPLRKKIGKDFPFMKADEWRSWCLVYSPVLLLVRLPHELAEAHYCLELFGRQCQNIYGIEFISPNMHLHLHLQETILNFGPIYGYWLFSFERYNGILKSYSTNKKDGFEGNFMRKYLEDVCKVDLARGILPFMENESHTFLISERVNNIPAVTIVSTPYAPISPTGFNLKNFLAFAESNIFGVKGNDPLPPSAHPLTLSAHSPMKEEEYAHLLEFYRTSYGNEYSRSYRDAVFGQKMISNMIQKIPFINLLDQHIFAYVK
ncbi:hypothetical protein CLU79DRAFT_734356 [Phycomyces nitens]|nr:hypothetical protein CLU79DRAFT_734356 [Phycomyces nitens]